MKKGYGILKKAERIAKTNPYRTATKEEFERSLNEILKDSRVRNVLKRLI